MKVLVVSLGILTLLLWVTDRALAHPGNVRALDCTHEEKKRGGRHAHHDRPFCDKGGATAESSRGSSADSVSASDGYVREEIRVPKPKRLETYPTGKPSITVFEYGNGKYKYITTLPPHYYRPDGTIRPEFDPRTNEGQFWALVERMRKLGWIR